MNPQNKLAFPFLAWLAALLSCPLDSCLGACCPPVITSQPTNAVANVGSNATFSVSVSSSLTVYYQWYFNTNNLLLFATNATLSLMNVQSSNAGNYSVLVSNAAGTATSSNGTLTVQASPTFTTQPANLTKTETAIATFTCAATGAPPITYQWSFNGNTIAGATNTTLSLTNIQAWQFGLYSVVASNVYGSTASTNATLTVTLPAGSAGCWGDNTYGQSTLQPGASGGFKAVAAGGQHSLALTTNGTVVGWGDNTYGQGVGPFGLTNVMAISAGYLHSMALRSNGTIMVWGDNSHGQTNVPAGLSNVVAISAGAYHCLAVRTNGTVVAWGDNTYGQTNVPATLTNAMLISAGWYHNLALTFDRNIVGWGNAVHGETIPPASATNIVALSAGNGFSLALRNAGTVVAWGDNSVGQTNLPAAATTAVAAISAGGYHGLALKNGGSTVAWGQNGSGETNIPGGIAVMQAVAAGAYHNVVLKGSGGPVITAQPFPVRGDMGATVAFATLAVGSGGLKYQWRVNGTDLPGATNSILILTNIQAWQAGMYSSQVTNAGGGNNPPALSTPAPLTVNTYPGNIIGWGFNGQGQITVPIGLTNVMAIACGGNHSLALGSNGLVTAWGYDGYGQTDVPPTLNSVMAISAGQYFSVALKSNGTVTAWGFDQSGQTNVPPGLSGVMAIAAGAAHVLALKTNGTVVPWGSNFYGQTNVPPGLNQVVAIAAGAEHSLALMDDGTVVAWGTNDNGQISIPPGLSNVVAIAAGDYHCVALKNDRTVVAWGNDSAGQVTGANGATNVVAIAAGGNHSIVIKGDGTVAAWGDDSQLPMGGISNAVAIAAGEFHSLALINDGSVAITVQPLNQTVQQGSRAEFRVMAIGAGSLGYQWRFNGANLAGATNSNHILPSPNTNKAGGYSVVVTNASSSATSITATLTILVPATLGSVGYVPGAFHFALTGSAGTYVISASTNLRTWLPIATNPTTPGGVLNFTNSVTPNIPIRFYRADWIGP